MPYIREECIIGDTIEVEKKHTGRYGAPGQKRAKRKKATPEEIEKRNYWNRVRKLRRKIGFNFTTKDWWVTLTYKQGNRPEAEQAKKNLKALLDKLRKYYKKAGKKLKYIIVTEYKQKAIHHHMIINNVSTKMWTTTEMIEKLWTIHGHPQYKHLYGGDYTQLAEYIIKETKAEQEKKKYSLSYSCSKNLPMPPVKRKVMLASEWRKEPTPKKGYYILQDTIVEGINPVTGFRYQHYIMAKIKP